MTDPDDYIGSVEPDLFGSDSDDWLSDCGRARMDAMLPALEASVVRQGRRRRVRRYAGRSAVGAAIFGIAAFIWTGNLSLPTSPMITRVDTPHPADESVPRIISILQSEPGAVGRLTVQRVVHLDEYRVDDQQLVTLLHAIGRPAGLVHVRGETRLTHAVTDKALAFSARPDDAKSPAPTLNRRSSRPQRG